MQTPSLVPRARARRWSDNGQATVEYFLAIILCSAVCIVALGAVRGSGLIESLFQAVIRQLMNDVG